MPGDAAKQAPGPAQLAVWGSDQATYSGQMRSPARLCGWAKSLAGISSSTVRRNLVC